MAERDVGGDGKKGGDPGCRARRRRDFMGDPRVLKPAAVIKKKLRRPRDRDATGIGCVLPKAGKRRDGARGSGANVPGPLSRLSRPLSRAFLSIPGDFPSPGRLAPENWSATTSAPGDRANANASPSFSCADYVVHS